MASFTWDVPTFLRIFSLAFFAEFLVTLLRVKKYCKKNKLILVALLDQILTKNKLISKLPGHALCGTLDGLSSRTVLDTQSCTG